MHHGRIEARTAIIIHEVTRLQVSHNRPDCKAVVVAESSREISGTIERQTRCYITSLAILARVRAEHAPAKFTTIKHMVLNLLRRPPGKLSLRGQRKAAFWDSEFFTSLLTP